VPLLLLLLLGLYVGHVSQSLLPMLLWTVVPLHYMYLGEECVLNYVFWGSECDEGALSCIYKEN
jgi:hypothetical protein